MRSTRPLERRAALPLPLVTAESVALAVMIAMVLVGFALRGVP